MKRYTLSVFLAFIFFAGNALAQNQPVQWASKLIDFSTQYDDTEFGAKFALGEPNVLPLGGDKAGAWAIGWYETSEGKKQELNESQHIWVAFSNPQRVQQIAIAENNAPGAISKIYLYDTKGKEYLIFEQQPMNVALAPRMFNVMIERTSYDVKEVRLVLEPDAVDGWNEIDAIGIADHRDSIKWEINLAKGLEAGAKMENLGSGINSSADEYMDAIAPDGRSIYFTRNGHPENIGGKEGKSDVWVSTRENGVWTTAKPVPGMINNSGSNFANSISPDGNTLCVGNKYNTDGTPAGQGVSISTRGANGWGVPVGLNIQNDQNKASFYNAYLSNDGKSLVIAVERDETVGGADLYVSFLNDDGSFSRPINLGPDVNTVMQEQGPALAADGRTLYFSSNGRSGYGDHDLFVARRLDDSWTKWSRPENLGPSINTSRGDKFYYISAAGDYAYFTSTAEGGYGGADIYRIKLPNAVKPKPVLLVSGRTFDANTRQPIEAKIKYEILPGGKESGIARSNVADGSYKIVLPAGSNYGFRAEAKGYYPASDNLDAKLLAEYTELTKDLYLTPIGVGSTIRLNNVFFETAKSDLREESFPELDRAVTFLNENPGFVIQIGGHTDNVGGDAANMTLSNARAKSVMDYLISKGIAKSMLTSKGFGETKPVANNDTEEGRQFNRRVEFTIVK